MYYGTLFPAGDIIDIFIEVSGPNVAILWDIAGPGEREAEKSSRARREK